MEEIVIDMTGARDGTDYLVDKVAQVTDELSLPFLDKWQRDAVLYPGNVLVVADFGTGKTRVCEAKVKLSIQKGLDVQYCTYTNEQMNEGKRRLGLLGNPLTLHKHRSRHGMVSFSTYDDLLKVRQPGEPLHDLLVVDEWQDATNVHYPIYNSLAKHHFRVGDPLQSIFSFAGANPLLIEQYKKDFKAEEFHLRINHRSAKSIVSTCNIFSGRDVEPEENALMGKVYIGYEWPTLENLLVLARYRKQLEQVETILTGLGTSYEVRDLSKNGKRSTRIVGNGTPTVVLSTIWCAKGTEGRKVLLLDFRKLPGEERNAFYVGITRAREELYIRPTYEGFSGDLRRWC